MDSENSQYKPERSGEELLNDLNKLAPLAEEDAENLSQIGYREFYSYHEYNANGSVNTPDIELALQRIRTETPVQGDWDVVRARVGQALKIDQSLGTGTREYDRVRALLKKETEQRIKWEEQQGYR